ncbi:M20/M25/M40 family metallo-hydrolase [Sediminibacterium sp. TEGAF015]|uniref:M20/M25/M40 family metallo-hydrolase n=1 Tax=Sediminibacterium sp. TEGAF015 TaxID=575378 RepID=UPI0021FCAC25|nr:M20/M25/M40 family metallo-hydrolase [Sediminibacterium sp. TEGAF015]BDQ12717.1 peptidase M20 [Sediminibacterium sp. TEGAF015]
MKKTLFICLIFISFISLHAQSLQPNEQKLIKRIEENYPEMMALLKNSVNINSGTFNIGGVKAVGDLYATELAKLGFTIEWITLPDSLKRAGHLVATRKGKKGKRIMLLGHLDTVFEPDMPANPFTVLNDSTITGQGINDMKGGDVIIIAAMKAMHELNLLNDATITIYMTGDEENAGEPRSISRGDFIERAKQHDIVLAFEGAAGLNTIATARRGSSGWELEVEGKQGHSSGVFGNAGYGAIYEAARIVNSFRETLSKEKYLTFNPGIFIGGSEVSANFEQQRGEASGKTNIISPKTYVNGDLRFLTEEQKNSARKTMQAIVSNSLAGTKAIIRFQDGIPSMAPTKGNEGLANILSKTSEDMGLGKVLPGDPGSRGAGDISYVAAYADCLDGLGAAGKGAHAPGETLNTKLYPILMKRGAVFIYRLIQ